MDYWLSCQDTFCIVTFLTSGKSWNAVGGERDICLHYELWDVKSILFPQSKLLNIWKTWLDDYNFNNKQHFFVVFDFRHYSWPQVSLTGAPCFVICLPLLAKGSITSTWGGQGGALRVFALDKTQLKVLLGSQSVIVKIVHESNTWTTE